MHIIQTFKVTSIKTKSKAFQGVKKDDVIALAVPVKDNYGGTPIQVLLYEEGKTTCNYIGTIQGGTLAQVLSYKTLELEEYDKPYPTKEED